MGGVHETNGEIKGKPPEPAAQVHLCAERFSPSFDVAESREALKVSREKDIQYAWIQSERIFKGRKKKE